jgi:hypothetical protein
LVKNNSSILEKNQMANYNRPAVAQSVVIDLKGRKVGSEDLRTVALVLTWVEQNGFYGKDLLVATNISQGLNDAVDMAERGEHEAAAKKAGNCLWILGKNKELAVAQHRQCLGSIGVMCRDGSTRKIGDMVEWFVGIHNRIAEQIREAKKMEESVREEDTVQYPLSKEAIRKAS